MKRPPSQTDMNKRKVQRWHFKKRCFFFLIFYTFIIIFSIAYVKNKVLNMYKFENCTVHNATILEIERNFNRNVNDYLKVFLKHTVIETNPVPQNWTLVENVHIFSAFLELCPTDLSLNSQFCIKFIGMTLSNSSSVSPFLSNFECIFKNRFNILNGENATVELLPESHSELYTAAFVFCPVKNLNLTHASLFKNESSNVTWLPVENNILSPMSYPYNYKALKIPKGISLCVRPLFGEFASIHFSEFIAYYSLMGVDHFVFYYFKSFNPVDTFLKFLKFTNVSYEVYLWDIPIDNDLIHQYGQIVFTQDCIARSKYKFSHTLIVDMDEYVVPQIHNDIRNLILYLEHKYTMSGSYVIPMVLFCDEYLVEKFDISPFHVLNHNIRQKTTWEHKYRSKYILRPDKVRHGGVHFTWKLENDYKEVFIPPDIALLYHYRACCGMAQTWLFQLLEFTVLSDKTVTDNILIEHEDELVNNSLLKFIFNVIFENKANF